MCNETKKSVSDRRLFWIVLYWNKCIKPWGSLKHYENGEERSVSFNGLAELVFSIEAACDGMGSPKSAGKQRSICTSSIAERSKAAMPGIDKNGTRRLCAAVNVVFRQNASIQGYAHIMKTRKPFRSGMELMKVLYEAMGYSENEAQPPHSELELEEG